MRILVADELVQRTFEVCREAAKLIGFRRVLVEARCT
jgi:hypothetical protein